MEYRLKKYRGIWCIVWRDGTTKRKSLGTSDRDEASRQFQDALKASAIPTGTIAEIMEAYLADKKDSARSYSSMLTAWRALKPTFGHLRPDQITRFQCRTYANMRRRTVSRLGTPISDGSVIKELGLLKAGVIWAKRGADATFEMPPTPPPREWHLTKADYERLLAACTSEHLVLFIELARATAARPEALFQLTWDRVDFARGRILLNRFESRRKGRANPPMNDRIRPRLERAYEARTCDHVIEWAGDPVKTVKRAFTTACRLAGVKGATPYIIRHSCAVWMIEDGQSFEEVAQYLGHSDPKMLFRVYGRFSPGHLKKVGRALE